MTTALNTNRHVPMVVHIGGSMKLLNVVGPKIRKIRYQLGWSQEELVDRLQAKGLAISRSGLAKIELQLHGVTDTDLVYFARALGVPLVELYPQMNLKGSFHETIQHLLRRHSLSKEEANLVQLAEQRQPRTGVN